MSRKKSKESPLDSSRRLGVNLFVYLIFIDFLFLELGLQLFRADA